MNPVAAKGNRLAEPVGGRAYRYHRVPSADYSAFPFGFMAIAVG